MRDPKRIKPFLEKIEQLWNSNPDLRFGQLVMAIAKTGESNPALFYMEDDEFGEKINDLKKHLNKE